jgi:hypothetical protein
MSVTTTILERVLENRTIILPPCDGGRIFSKARDVFGCIDPGLRLWDADEPGADTPETSVRVYELREDADFLTMFGSLSADIGSLCLTQSQIVAFCERHSEKLPSLRSNFFLFKRSGGDLLVARVIETCDTLSLALHHVGSDRCWWAADRCRVVVPHAA